MRLWHQKLIPYLPRQQLLGQHRECCALRGAGWGRKHATVDYVFKYSPDWLVAYHFCVIAEMERRGYHPDPIWQDPEWRGKTLGKCSGWSGEGTVKFLVCLYGLYTDEGVLRKSIYPEHDDKYLEECLENLKGKGIDLYDSVCSL